MKKVFLLAAFLQVISFCSSGQIYKDGTNYSGIIQIDSSEYYIISKLIDKNSKSKYGMSRGYGNEATNIYIYNSRLKQSKALFSLSPALISAVVADYKIYNRGYGGQGIKSSTILTDDLLFLAQDKDYNGDGIIDDDDPAYLFVSTKSGDDLTRITPVDMNVVSWTASNDGRVLIVRLQKDANNDKKFTSESELIYEIDLNKDISKIKITPIPL